MEDTRFPVDRLEGFVRAAAEAQGVSTEHARIFAKRMIEADLRGMHGHGIFRLVPYSRRLREGGYNLRPNIRAVRETASTALVDGDNGLGQVVMTHAAELAFEKARETGLAWIGVRGNNHSGAGGVYAALALQHDMVSMYMAVASANHMAPWGGVDLLLGTNPIAFAIPTAEEPPFVLDIATTVTSYGKLKVYAQSGTPLPEGWVVDRNGEPITDASRAHEGFLLPIGGYKGYGLNLVIGMLAGVMNGAAFGSTVIDFNEDFESPPNIGQAYFVMRPDLFGDLAEFKAEMDLRVREIRNSTPMTGQGPVRIPGEMAAQREKDMRQNGIPVAAPVLEGVRQLADSLGLQDRLR